MTAKEIQASDEEMEQFNVSQNKKCVSVKKEKLNDLMNKISFALKDATLAQGFEIICKRIAELEKELMHLKGCKTCTDRPKGELATVCATEYEGHCIAQKMTYIKELQEENEELKKNALVWHDLRKNPNDLPEEGIEVLVLYSNTYGDGRYIVNKHTLNYELAQYINDEEDTSEWYWVETGTDYDIHEVIAWCELPKFEE